MKMKPAYFVVLLLCCLACKKNENQKATVDLQFQARAAGTNYVLASDFTNGNGINVRIESLWFYLSNVRFVTNKGKEVVAEDIALVKLDANGFASVPVKIPKGDYKALRFGIGVPQEMNEADPSEYNESDHPLSVTQNTYWGMNGMYRFIMLDGRYDIEGDGTIDGTFSYHTGYNECYREIQVDKSYSFDRKGEYTQVLTIDLEKIFNAGSSVVNVVTESNYHGSLSELDIATRISDNFAVAISAQ